MKNFTNYSNYYDLLYKDKNYKEEVSYVLKKIAMFMPNSNSILELGCGSGSHAKYFCEQDFKVTGIERSNEMIEVAKQKNISNFSPVNGDIIDYCLDQKFDVAISLFHVISYLTANESLIQCFKNVHNHLNTDGLFVFDVWYAPAVYHQEPEVRIKRMENEDIKVIRIAEPFHDTLANIVEVNFEVNIINKSTNLLETLVEKHPMRYFSTPEIRLLAMQTGFEVLEVEEFLTENNPSKNTWGVCFILKKI